MLYENTEKYTGHMFLAGNQKKLLHLDLGTLKFLRTIPDISENGGMDNCYFIKSHPKYICMASEDKVSS